MGRSPRLRVLWLVWLLLLGLVQPGLAATFFVATSGNDTTGDGSSGNPWASINHCATTAGAGNTCAIRTGTYRETVIPNANNMTFQPDAGASVTVSGADLVTGTWTVFSGSIYQNTTGVTWNLTGPNSTQTVGWNQVFVDGQMMTLARWPNSSNPLQRATSSATVVHPTSSEASDTGFNPWVFSDSALPSGNWAGAEVTFEQSFVLQSGVVTSSSSGQFTFTNLQAPEERTFQSGFGSSGTHYYLSNSLTALDTAGEWYLNTSTHTLYLWTPNNASPTTHTVEAKHRQYAFQLLGRSGIHVNNITVFAAAIMTDSASSNNVFDGIHATYVWHQLRNVPNTNIVSENFAPNPSLDAVWANFQSGIYLDGTNNTFQNCTVAWSSHDGFFLHGNGQIVKNCTIHDVDYQGGDAAAVSFPGDQAHYQIPNHTSNHQVTYNTIYNTGRNGMQTLGMGFLVSHNLIHDVGYVTRDHGFLYAFNQDETAESQQLRGEWSYNVCYNNHDTTGDPKGLYLDGSSAQMTVHHNVIYRTDTSTYLDEGIMIQNTTNNNNIYNNTVFNVGAANADIGIEGTSSNNDVRNNLTSTGLFGGGSCSSCTTSPNTTGAVSGDFTNAAGGNFTLSSGSKGRNAGVQIAGITTAFSDPSPAAGAYEFNQPAWTVGAQPLTPPTVVITAPTSNPTFSTTTTPLTTLAGTASAVSPATLQSVTWSCPTCTPSSGTTGGTLASWSVASIGLASGVNTITVTATDSTNQSGSDSLAVTLTTTVVPQRRALLPFFRGKR